MISEKFSALLAPYKYLSITVLAGVIVASGLTVYTRRKLALATQLEQQADQYRQEGQAAWKEAFRLKDYADKLQTDLQKANAKIDKLQAAVEKIPVPPKPGPAPEQKQQLISDLQGMGLQLVIKPSTTIAPSLVGITEGDGKTIWSWGKENLRVPFLEQKIVAQQNLVTGLTKAKDLAETLADSRSKQADAAMRAADKFQEDADLQRKIAIDLKKAYSAEKKKRLLYAAGAFVGGYYIHKELVK